MPPKKNPALNDSDSSETTSNPPVIAFTQEQFSMFMQQFRESARDANQEMLTQVRSTTPTLSNDNGSFVKCTARFTATDTDNVEAFIDNMVTYKDCMKISDENAVRGLPMLLEGYAASWWQGVKHTITDWNSVITTLRDVFSKKLPAPLIYREIFSREQKDLESTEVFICRIRALFSQLNYTLPEEAQLDMAYGLLSRKVRKRLPRSDVCTFNELLKRTREIEHSLKEVSEKNIKIANEKDSNVNQKTRIKCLYCKSYGHSRNDCLKLKRKESEKVSSSGPHQTASGLKKPNTISCFGCGTPGFIRSNCPTCRKEEAAADTIEFYSAMTNNAPSKRPALKIEICNSKGIAYIDTGATQSIAGYSLYQILQDKGCKFKRIVKTIVYADGNPTTEEVLTTDVVVTLESYLIPLSLLILPKCTENRTLLGIDFICKAGLVLDVPNQQWWFNNKPYIKYHFENGDTRQRVTEIDIMSFSVLRSDEGAKLEETEKYKIENLLAQYTDVFQLNSAPTTFAEHRIETGDTAPISVPPYRLSPIKKDILVKELTDMLNSGIIEECESPWAAPVVLVPKKDGSTRVCIDYRRLNSVTVSDSYPLPRLDDLLHLAERTPYMTTIDLRAGYWQVPVRKCDRDKTAFITPLGTFRFLRMPFGLRNAPATFQRLIDRFRGGLPNVNILAYLDDIIILSETFEKHVTDLKLVFDRLKLFGLCAKREKCSFVCARVKFLGHYITDSGIQVDPDKVTAILNFAPPRNLKHLQSFLQTCSWYRRFIPTFSDIARPLTDLTKKKAIWTWGPVQQEAYDTLKRLLTSAPILRQANQTLPFAVRTDASNYALGACLMQGEGDDERPVEFASRLLTSAERNYSTTEREALAVVWSMEKFRGYLEGSKVNVYTDHQALKWLMELKSPSGRLARWALILQGYDLVIKYTPGKTNVVADTLSRPPCSEDACPICTVSITVPTQDVREVREKQVADAELSEIITALEKCDDGVNYLKWMNRGYMMSNGILYRYNPDVCEETAQLVIPEVERKEILQKYHDNSLAGHNGYEGTYQRISKRYFWPGMTRSIQEYVKRCPECQRYKVTNLRPAGLLQTPVMKQRFETLSIDLFGPLPETHLKEKWIFIVEDTATKWVELFPLIEATAIACANVLINDVFFRFGTPRKIISDNGTQFVGSVMQHALHCLGVTQTLIPVYHPEANPVERKNRELKIQLSILVGVEHTTWSAHLPAIRFALNTARCQSTGYSAAFLTYGTDLRTPDDVKRDLRAIVQNETFEEQITPHLLKTANILRSVREINESEQDRWKKNSDRSRRETPIYEKGDKVLVKVHTQSKKKKGFTTKFVPRRDGPYVILNRCLPTTYAIGDPQNPGSNFGVYHTTDLTPFVESSEKKSQPIQPLRKRGRPPKKTNISAD